MRVLLLSAYDAGSHRYWRRGLEAMLPQWQWQSLALPPRHFSWRVRGNALHWALRERPLLESNPDLLVATSMVDLATLRGLVPALTRVPTLLYFHENQFAYPLGRGDHGPVEAQMVSLYSALAADRIAFNSEWNRSSFLAGVESLLRKLPDYAPLEAAELLRNRSEVIPVALLPDDNESSGFDPWRRAGKVGERPLRLLWPGRLEYDKGGEGLEALLAELEHRNLDYELAIVGQEFRSLPPAFQRIRDGYSRRLVQFGWLPREADYRGLLSQADIVLATALHEFQGVAVMEAVARGCVPVLPDRLAYPELYPRDCLYVSYPDDLKREARAAASRIEESASLLGAGTRVAPSVDSYTLRALQPAYQRLLGELARGGESR